MQHSVILVVEALFENVVLSQSRLVLIKKGEKELPRSAAKVSTTWKLLKANRNSLMCFITANQNGSEKKNKAQVYCCLSSFLSSVCSNAEFVYQELIMTQFTHSYCPFHFVHLFVLRFTLEIHFQSSCYCLQGDNIVTCICFQNMNHILSQVVWEENKSLCLLCGMCYIYVSTVQLPLLGKAISLVIMIHKTRPYCRSNSIGLTIMRQQYYT